MLLKGVSCGILRGLGLQKYGATVNFIGLDIIGLPLGAVFAIVLRWGVMGKDHYLTSYLHPFSLTIVSFQHPISLIILLIFAKIRLSDVSFFALIFSNILCHICTLCHMCTHFL